MKSVSKKDKKRYSLDMEGIKPVYLGIDYGKKRTGLAICDNGSIAFPLQTVSTPLEVAAIIKNRHVTDVVIGKSLNLDGTQNAVHIDAEVFVAALIKVLEVEGLDEISIHWHEERLTSHQASQEFFSMEAKGQERRGRNVSTDKKKADNLDERAAAIILQGYLDRLAAKNS